MHAEIEETNRRGQNHKEALGKIADLVMDIIKLVFAGVILSGIIDMTVDKIMLFVSGVVVSVILFALWYVLFKRSKRKD